MSKETTQDLITLVNATPAMMFTDEELPNRLFLHIEKEIEAFVPDLSTQESRKKIGSLAYKVAQTKTAVDAAGKKLNEEHRKAINAVDADRRTYWERLEKLQALARKPLTDWEEAEEKRQAAITNTLEAFRKASIVTVAETAVIVQERLDKVKATELPPDIFGAMLDAAKLEQERAINTLTSIVAALTKQEADAAELKRLQDAEAERQAKEAEEARKADEAAVAKAREEKAASDAAAAAKAQADREAADAIAAANRRAEEAEEANRAAQRQREAEEAEANKRAADKEHRETVIKEAVAGLAQTIPSMPTSHGLRIVQAILEGRIPHVTLEF